MIVGSKIILSTDRPVLDTNAKILQSGIYTFKVLSFGDGNTVKGQIVENPGQGDFVFKSFTIINLMAKAQSFMFRRLNRNNPIGAEVTNHPSPSNSPYALRKSLQQPPPRREETCAICLEKCKKKTPCGHYFHRQCIDTWRRRSARCPVCRRRLARYVPLTIGSPMHSQAVERGFQNLVLPSIDRRTRQYGEHRRSRSVLRF